MKKILILVICIFLVAGCVQKTGDPVKEKKSKRPTASGNAYDVLELEFYLPTQFKRNKDNINTLYEFYTGKLEKQNSSELYVLVTTKAIDEKFKLEDYVKKQTDINYKSKKINKFDWYVAKYDKKSYYTATYRSNLYTVEIRKNSDPDKIYNDTIKMFERTLFFEIIEAK